MRDTLNPSCRAIENPPAVFATWRSSADAIDGQVSRAGRAGVATGRN